MNEDHTKKESVASVWKHILTDYLPKLWRNLVLFAVILVLGFVSIQLYADNRILKKEVGELSAHEMSAETLREQIRQISEYAAYELDYTEVLEFSNVSMMGDFAIPLTDNEFIATIDGVVKIGINGENIGFSEIEDEDGKVKGVSINLPHSQILDNHTIQDSLHIYYVKNNIFNPVDINDYKDVNVQAQEKQAEKVENSQLLQQSDERIRSLLEAHFRSVYGNEVEIEFNYIT